MKAPLLALVLLFGPVGVRLGGQVSAPRIGFVSDLAGSLRPVMGVSGSFLLGDVLAESVLSAGFCGTFGFIKRDATLSILEEANQTDFPAPAGRALFSFSGHVGFVYYESAGTLQRWDGVNLSTIPLGSFAGSVLALAQPDPGHIWLAVRQSDRQVYALLFDGLNGTLQSSTPLTGASGNLALLNGQEFVYAGERGLALHRANGTEIPLAAPGTGEMADLHFELMGMNWWSIKGKGGQHFALRTEPGREGLYRLPGHTRPENRQ